MKFDMSRMRRKATVQTVQFILLIAICVVGFLFIFHLLVSASNAACKRAQMDELGKIWRELRYWESKGESAGKTSFNIIPGFNVKPCVKGITYEPKTYEPGKVVLEWTDGGKEEIPAKGEWILCNKALIPGTYDVKVSFMRVEFFYEGGGSFCPEEKE
jgi:hypothetical protein